MKAMSEADSVHSTPPINASADTPLDDPAESVDSFSHQPALGRPESRTLTGDSPIPVETLVGRQVPVPAEVGQ
jgi:hypothetical protein